MAFLSTFVGAGKYSDPGIRDLLGSTRDAIALHALFSDTLSDVSPTLLIDDQATVANIRRALQDTLGDATSDDVVIFSFSGHGSHDHRLAVFDTRLSDLANTTIGMDELGDLFKSTSARAVLCVLDCCFSGGAPAKVLEDSPIPRDPTAPLEALVGEGRILLAASGVDQVAYEIPSSRHSHKGAFGLASRSGIFARPARVCQRRHENGSGRSGSPGSYANTSATWNRQGWAKPAKTETREALLRGISRVPASRCH